MAARQYFGISDNPNLVLHHIDKTLKYKDINRYNEWNPDDLVVMTISEHISLHQSGEGNSMYGKGGMTGHQQSEYQKQRVKECNTGVVFTEERKSKISSSKKGKSWTDKQREALIGLHWFNNGEISIRSKECPEGFTKGRLGVKNNVK